MSENCPVCETNLNETSHCRHSGWECYSCPMCGEFAMAEWRLRFLPTMEKPPDWRAILSHAIRQSWEKGKRLALNSDSLSRILENKRLPTPKEQADNLILWLGDNLADAAQYRKIAAVPHQAIIGARTPDEVFFIIESLGKKGLLEESSSRLGGLLVERDVRLTFDGWERYEELKRTISDSRNAFMAMQYGKDKDEKEKLDKFFKCLKEEVKQTGFELERVDKKPKAGSIEDHIREGIRSARFLVADLTYANPGAYWEAGFAAALHKPVIFTCEKNYFDQEGTHFDVRQQQTILWEEGKLEQAAKQLKAAIRATLPADAKMTDE